MAVWDKKIIWGFMLLLAGAVGQSVKYPHRVCAMKGSTVTLPCTFEIPESVTENGKEVMININRVIWCPNHLICHATTPSVYDSKSDNNNPRYRYLGDKKGNCTLQITNLQEEDSATFRFRVKTNHNKATFTGQRGVKVTVGDSKMMIKSSSTETEMRVGESVTLRCTAVCTFHQLEVTWFRDDSALSETGPALKLDPLTARDSGNYTCGLRNNNLTLSQPYSLNVEAEDGTTSAAVDTMLAIRVVFFALHTVLIIIVASIIIKRTCVRRKAAAEM